MLLQRVCCEDRDVGGAVACWAGFLIVCRCAHWAMEARVRGIPRAIGAQVVPAWKNACIAFKWALHDTVCVIDGMVLFAVPLWHRPDRSSD